MPKTFLSTPSGWRATYEVLCKLAAFLFLSTPSGWRATSLNRTIWYKNDFYPRPPGGGRRVGMNPSRQRIIISIHALRVEGDVLTPMPIRLFSTISIHALRVEGDSKNGQSFRLFLRKREKNLPL